jgi:CheY-like chemotaxis protein
MAHILLIEDDDGVRVMLRDTLVHYGHEVTEARNGREGLELYFQIKPDLLITDIVMPEKEGLELLMELRKRHQHAKVIAISGGGQKQRADYLQMARLMGAAQVLAKPFGNEALRAAVADVLAGGRTLTRR